MAILLRRILPLYVMRGQVYLHMYGVASFPMFGMSLRWTVDTFILAALVYSAPLRRNLAHSGAILPSFPIH